MFCYCLNSYCTPNQSCIFKIHLCISTNVSSNRSVSEDAATNIAFCPFSLVIFENCQLSGSEFCLHEEGTAIRQISSSENSVCSILSGSLIISISLIKSFSLAFDHNVCYFLFTCRTKINNSYIFSIILFLYTKFSICLNLQMENLLNLNIIYCHYILFLYFVNYYSFWYFLIFLNIHAYLLTLMSSTRSVHVHDENIDALGLKSSFSI